MDFLLSSKQVRCKGIFLKGNEGGCYNRQFKEKLVAKGFTQMQGLDYFDAYIPIERICTIGL